jgi:hypothetical protein
LLTIGLASERYGAELERQQEVLMNISDILMEVFAMESSLLRRRKLEASGDATNAAEKCAVFLRDAMERIEIAFKTVIGTCSEPNSLHQNLRALRSLANYDPVDAIALRRNIAGRLLSAGGYRV